MEHISLADNSLHSQFQLRKDSFSKVRLSVITKLLSSIPEEKAKPEVQPIPETAIDISGVRFVQYSERATAIIGDTKPIKDLLKEAKASWNRNLTIDGKKVQGWILPTKRAIELENRLKAGTSETSGSVPKPKANGTTSARTGRAKADISKYLQWTPPPLWDKNSDETFRMVTDAIARKELLEEFADEVENLKALITDLDTVPDTWTDTKKAWTENNKKERAYLSEQRNSLSKLVTALKNNDNNADVEKAVRERQNELMKKQHGVLTEQQIQDFVKYRDELSFKSVAKSMDYFPTPPNIVDMLIEKADLKCGQMILEPSAGKGNIAEAIQQKVGDCATLHVVEYSDYNRLTLEAKNYTVVGSDFLNFGVKERNDRGLPIYEDGVLYDRIVMNPPFQDGMDFMHITHAYKMLADDGVLVAIVPSSSYVGLGRDATEKNAFIEANEGTINIIKAAEYNRQMEFTQLTIDIAIITLRRRNVERYTSSMTSTDNSQYSSYMDLPEKGEIELPALDVENTDKDFVVPATVTAQPQFVNVDVPDYVAQIKTEKPLTLFDYQRFGVNKAIDALSNSGGFLLADGTGTGKTIQMLFTALYFYQVTKKPVVIFTIDRKVINTAFMKDGKKMRFPVPEYIPESELEEVPRPDSYRGLYDSLDDKVKKTDEEIIIPDKNFPPIYYGDERTLKIRNGINLITYNALSRIDIDDKRIEEKVKKLQDQLKINETFWEEVKIVGSRNLYKNKNTDKMKTLFSSFNKGFVEIEGTDEEKQTLIRKNAHVWYNEIMPKCIEDDFARYYTLFKSNLDLKLPVPKVERAQVALMLAEDEYTQAIRNKLGDITNKTSLVIFDEAHKVKNLLLNLEKQAGRAFYADFISSGASRVMFATATPTDRPFDIMYLKRAGLFENDDNFQQIMARVGVYYKPEERNSENQVIRRGRWVSPKNEEGMELANFYLSSIFDYLTRKGNMLRREIQYTNLDANFIDITVPHSIIDELQQVKEEASFIDKRGIRRVNRLKELQWSQQLVEEYKLDEVINITDKEIAEGRSVIVFTSMVDTEERNDGSQKIGSIRILKNRLALRYGEDAVGVLATTSGKYEKYKALKNVDDFQKNKKRILIATIFSGGTGVSLDDQIGHAPRTIIVVTPPLSFINVIQGIGRVVRANTKSRSRVYFLSAKTDHPDKSQSVIPVERWLKNLIGNKFRTLHAAVKGEIEVLDPTKTNILEQGGESAVAAMIDAELDKAPKQHSLYSKTNAVYNGWDMPSKSAISVTRMGTQYEHSCFIRAKSKEELFTWAAENPEFIAKYNLVLNLDKNFQRYNGYHYGVTFRHSDKNDWKESYDVWNAMLNLIKPEESKYLVTQQSAFDIGEQVVATTDLLLSNTKAGTVGTIEHIIAVNRGKNKDGDVVQYMYDVIWSNKKKSISLESWQLKKKDVVDETSLKDFFVLYNGDENTKNVYDEIQKDIKTHKKGNKYSKKRQGEFKIDIVVDSDKSGYTMTGTYWLGYSKLLDILTSENVGSEVEYPNMNYIKKESIEKLLSYGNLIIKAKFDTDKQKIVNVTYGDNALPKTLNDGLSDRSLSGARQKVVTAICKKLYLNLYNLEHSQKNEALYLMGNKKGAWGKMTEADQKRFSKITTLESQMQKVKSLCGCCLDVKSLNDDMPTLADTDLTKKGFYSRLDKAVEQLPEKVKKQSFLNTLKKSKEGVSSKELDLVNINKLLETKGDTITKDDVNIYLGVHGYSIYETILGQKKDFEYELRKRIRMEVETFHIYDSPEIIQECITKFENNIDGILSYIKNIVEKIKTLRNEGKIDVLEDFEDDWEEIVEYIDKYINKIKYLSEVGRIDDYRSENTIEKYFDYIDLVSFAPHFEEAIKVYENFYGQSGYFFMGTILSSAESAISNLIRLLHPYMLTSIIDDRDESIKKEMIESIKYELKNQEKHKKLPIDGKTYYNNFTTENRDYPNEEYYEYLYHLRTKDGGYLVESDGEKLIKLIKYTSGHFSYFGDNLLGHYRCSYIEDAYLGVHCFIEEIQSDWTQDLRYRDSSPFPSNSDFIEFIIKVIIVNAVKYGAETIMFTSGEMQNKRWNKEYSQLKYIQWEKKGTYTYFLDVTTGNGKKTVTLKESELVSHFGKEIAKKILEKDNGNMYLEPGIFYGDKGFTEMYGSTQQDTIGIIGKKFNELLKPYGEKVTIQYFSNDDVFGFTIPEKLKEKILNDEHSFPLMDGNPQQMTFFDDMPTLADSQQMTFFDEPAMATLSDNTYVEAYPHYYLNPRHYGVRGNIIKKVIENNNFDKTLYFTIIAPIRYNDFWESATVNGVEDVDGKLIPCRYENFWIPTINVRTGRIINWEQGKEAKINYKVIDAAQYILHTFLGRKFPSINNEFQYKNSSVMAVYGLQGAYVPDWFDLNGDGYGDYIQLTIDKNGYIKNWSKNRFSKLTDQQIFDKVMKYFTKDENYHHFMRLIHSGGYMSLSENPQY